jgi:hypothetical protein
MDENELIERLAAWMADAYKATEQAGGVPDAIVRQMPPALIGLLARNRVHLVYVPPK